MRGRFSLLRGMSARRGWERGGVHARRQRRRLAALQGEVARCLMACIDGPHFSERHGLARHGEVLRDLEALHGVNVKESLEAKNERTRGQTVMRMGV